MFESLLDGRRMYFRLHDIALLLLVLVMLGGVGRPAVADDKVTGIIPGTNYQATSMDEWHYAKVLLGEEGKPSETLGRPHPIPAHQFRPIDDRPCGTGI